MDTLFADFADLDASMQACLTVALKSVELTYLKIYEASVKRTVEAWQKDFGAKCPQTVARFIEEFRADAEDFKIKKLPPFLENIHEATTAKDLKKSFREMSGRGNILGILAILAGNETEDNIDIVHHVTARHRLLDLYVAVDVNTAILNKASNDERGAKAVYEKIAVTEEEDD